MWIIKNNSNHRHKTLFSWFLIVVCIFHEICIYIYASSMLFKVMTVTLLKLVSRECDPTPTLSEPGEGRSDHLHMEWLLRGCQGEGWKHHHSFTSGKIPLKSYPAKTKTNKYICKYKSIHSFLMYLYLHMCMTCLECSLLLWFCCRWWDQSPMLGCMTQLHRSTRYAVIHC